jgi:uncharacterized protein with HEPN domain
MNDEINKWLFDILEAIQSINQYIGDVRKFELYEKDKKLRRAVEREIEIIGEAVNRIQKENSDLEISNARQIIATRNRVSHAYDAVDNAIIWGVVINHLPNLQTEINQLLKTEI